MEPLSREIPAAAVPDAALRMWWLGQAGFAFKTPAGRIVYADPYLSDAVERLHGFKRLSLPPIAAEEVSADLVVLTHEHADHLDPDAIAVIARRNPQCRFAGPAGCTEGLERAGVPPQRRSLLEPGRAHDLGGVVVHAVAADHGDDSPSALTLLLDFAGVRVLLSGDTSLRLGLLRPLVDLRPDLVLPCINGVFGNMGPIDAAMLVHEARPRYAIPCHFGMFAEQGASDPGGFLYACRNFSPGVSAMILKPGKCFVCRAAER